MKKKVYQHPTMKVVKLQHKSHILSDSMTSTGGPLNYGGAGGNREANSRSNSGWDDEEDW